MLSITILVISLVYSQAVQHNLLGKAGERCWDPILNRFFVGTEKCDNENSDDMCDLMFPADFEANQRRVDEGFPPLATQSCEYEELREEAKKCAKNCYTCCEAPRSAMIDNYGGGQICKSIQIQLLEPSNKCQFQLRHEGSQMF